TNDYINTTYTAPLSKSTTLMAGMAWSDTPDRKNIDSSRLNETDKSLQARFTINHHFTNRLGLKTGIEFTSDKFNQDYFNSLDHQDYLTGYTENITSGFLESEYAPINKLALRAGVRSEYSSLLQKSNLMPRLSMAFKTSENAQISLAYGIFYQDPSATALRFTHRLGFEQANHYILNYQINKNDRIFRVEAYYKDYLHLLRYAVENDPDPSTYNNLGQGYAKGIDLFFRDQKSIKNLDYWLTYSFIDSKRLYNDFAQSATPSFISSHNANAVIKYFSVKLQTMIGLTYTYASGRPYYNPNSTGFMSDRTKSYHDVSMNLSYLTHIFGCFTIVYCSVSNLFGFNNVYGYHYSTVADANGQFAPRAIMPDAKRFAMMAMFISIEKKKKQ
ncbi:MAG: TonB-dependent receptor, partial [Bacteroidota bacterium]|nr:TonB-dependent receptor [Bacteroidota bacterium]